MDGRNLSENPVVIEVQGVRKAFRVYSDRSHTLKETLIFWKRTSFAPHEVLRGVDLAVRKGETLALIGQNGSGKSTLLKLLTGIIYPDAGSIQIKGKVSSLLELGAGFHPDFSGRENIYNNASIFGLTKREIDKRYEKIVAFSELEEYIDTPVRTYSSGMYMRLAFSVAINVDAEILLIDEILAVGDAAFQKKCMDMIRTLKRRGVTIVFVTHDMGAVEKICDRVVWLEKGVLREDGEPRKIVDQYLLSMEQKSAAIAQQALEDEQRAAQMAVQEMDGLVADVELPVSPSATEELCEYNETGERIRWGNGRIQILSVDFEGTGLADSSAIQGGEPLAVHIRYKCLAEVPSAVFGMRITNTKNELCISTNTLTRDCDVKIAGENEEGVVSFFFERMDMIGGRYAVEVYVTDRDEFPFDVQREKYAFSIASVIRETGVYAPVVQIASEVL